MEDTGEARFLICDLFVPIFATFHFYPHFVQPLQAIPIPQRGHLSSSFAQIVKFCTPPPPLFVKEFLVPERLVKR